MSGLSRYSLAGAFLICVLLVACGSDSPRNTGNRAPTAPSAPAPPTIDRLDLVAPRSIAPGQTVQLSATIVRSDGSREEVTGQAQWRASDANVVVIDAAGIATAKTIGETFISVSHLGRSASSHLFVLPSGTFRLDGGILEAGLGLGVAGATVAVISGTGEGLATRTDADGRFRLYGVNGPVRLHVKREGYVNRIEEVDVSDHRSINVELALERPRNDLSGIYTLTLEAGPCTSSFGTLPEDARRRSYTAHLRQEGSRIAVRLTDADFIVTDGHGDRFEGSAGANRTVSFRIGLGNYYYYYFYESSKFDLVERFGSGGALLVGGTASTQETSTGLSGSLSGGFQLARGTTAPFTSMSASCFGSSHRFELRRR